MEKDEKEELKSRLASRVSDAGKQEEPEEEVLSTEVTEEDLAVAVEDEFGAKYSKDGKRLLKARKDVETYEIRQGMRVICDRAFEFCWKLQSVAIPSSVTRIGDHAFADCRKLQSVSIPSSVTRIGDSAFEECRSLRSVAISSSVTDIGDWAFCECRSMKSVVIPSSVTRIGDCAFWGCGKLQSVSISSGVTDIGNYAFRECESLQSVVIPSSVTRIGDRAFWECKSLQSVAILSSVIRIDKNPFVGCKCDIHSPHFTVKDNVLYNSDMSVLIACLSKQTTFSIPSSVTCIGNSVFEVCDSLQLIGIPKGNREKFEKMLWSYNNIDELLVEI